MKTSNAKKNTNSQTTHVLPRFHRRKSVGFFVCWDYTTKQNPPIRRSANFPPSYSNPHRKPAAARIRPAACFRTGCMVRAPRRRAAARLYPGPISVFFSNLTFLSYSVLSHCQRFWLVYLFDIWTSSCELATIPQPVHWNIFRLTYSVCLHF